jgi:hypothetical protein
MPNDLGHDKILQWTDDIWTVDAGRKRLGKLFTVATLSNVSSPLRIDYLQKKFGAGV